MSRTTTPSPLRRRLLQTVGVASVIIGIAAVSLAMYHNRGLGAVNRDIAPDGVPDEERVLRTLSLLSQWRYFEPARIEAPVPRLLARLEHASPMHLSAWSVLNAGVDHSGACGGTTRAMVVLLRKSGVPARKAILYEATGLPRHTVVEVRLDGEWRVFDPTYGYYWRRDRDGRIATAADLRDDPTLLPRILSQVPNYPVRQYHYRDVHHLRWEKIPGLGALRSFLTRVKGDAWVQRVGTPYLYERPYLLFGMLAIVFGVLALLGALLQRRPHSSSGRHLPRGFAPRLS